MVATVGSISIDLSTNLGKFASGFKGAATTVEQQSGRLAKSLGAIEKSAGLAAAGIKGLIGGFVAELGLKSITGVIDRTTAAISRFDDIAANAKTVGLRTDAYQALGFAAKQANIDQEQFNSALEIFAKNVGLAEHGTGALFSSLKNLNPQLLQNILNAGNQEDRLKAVADAMAGISDETQRAAIATAVFGKSGVALVRLFEGGAKSIDHFKQVAKDLGIIIPDDLLQKAGELDDKLDLLSTVINNKLDASLVRIAPALVNAAEALSSFIDATAKAQTEVGNNLGQMNDALDKFENRPNTSSLLDFLLGPEGGAGVSGFFRDLVSSADQSTGNINDDIAEVQRRLDILAGPNAEYSFDVKAETDEANKKLDELHAKLISFSNDARAKLAEQFRDAENASMAALDRLHQLPLVHGSNLNPNNGPIRQEINGVGVTKFGQDNSDILKSIQDQVDATNGTTDAANDTTGAVTDGAKQTSAGLSSLGADLSVLDKSLALATAHAADGIITCIRQLGSSIGYGRFLGQHSDNSGLGGISSLSDALHVLGGAPTVNYASGAQLDFGDPLGSINKFAGQFGDFITGQTHASGGHQYTVSSPHPSFMAHDMIQPSSDTVNNTPITINSPIVLPAGFTPTPQALAAIRQAQTDAVSAALRRGLGR